MEWRQILKEKKFWIASFIVVWAASLQVTPFTPCLVSEKMWDFSLVELSMTYPSRM